MCIFYLFVLAFGSAFSLSPYEDAILSELSQRPHQTGSLSNAMHKMELRALHNRNQGAMQLHEVRVRKND